MNNNPKWNSDSYQRSMANIEVLAQPLLNLLSYTQGLNLLDLGCGDGRLTSLLIKNGYSVIAIDANSSMIDAACARGVDARLINALELPYVDQFNVVFSHAALHWIKPPKAVLQLIYQSLKANGHFIAMFGGFGDLAVVRDAIVRSLAKHGLKPQSTVNWYNPTAVEYEELLIDTGFQIEVPTELAHINYPLPNGMAGYIYDFFGHSLLEGLDKPTQTTIVKQALKTMGPQLCDKNGNWHADFVRIRVCAKKILPIKN